MNRIISFFTAIGIMASAALAADNISASIQGAYNTEYLINGVTYASDAPSAGFAIGSQYLGVDVGVNGTVLPTSKGLNQSIWGLGLGKAFTVSEQDKLTLRATGNVSRLLSGNSIVPNTTFADVGVALENPYVTPYVKAAYGVEIEQLGVAAGLKRDFNIFGLFTATPSFEYGCFTDYSYYLGKIGVSRVLFGHLEVFGEGSFVHNSFDVLGGNFAIRQLDNEFIGGGGIRWRF